MLIDNCTIVPMTDTGKRCFTGSLGVSGNRITMVSDSSDGEAHAFRTEDFARRAGDGLRRVDAAGMALMPGLVNCHNHAAMSLMRGYADDMPLLRWLNDYIWPFEARLDGAAIRAGMELSICEMLAGGTTTFADMYWMEEQAFASVERAGIRAILGATFTDPSYERFEVDLHALLCRVGGHAQGRIGAMIAPHAPYTCSPEHLRRAVRLAERHDLMLYTHLSETRDEVEQIRARHGLSPAEYLREQGFFTRPATAVHCVHLGAKDIELLARQRVAVVHNPESNMKLASGAAPVRQMMEGGLTVALGTDGPCSNNDLDMWEEMRSAAFLSKVSTGDPLTLPAWEMLRMATVCGAKALRMDDRIGTLAEGMLADMILVDMRRPHLQPVHDPISNLAYCAKASDVAMTVVDGRVVAENGRCTTLDSAAAIRAARECVERLSAESNG